MSRLPTYIIAGSMRCGTTALNSYLRQHPDVAVSSNKEVHFFDHHYDLGVDWYLEHFTEAGDAIAVGEATPNYMFDTMALDRIRELLPDVKLVVMLRNPIDRAYSHYWHERARDKTSLSFEKAVRDELDGLPGPEPFVARGRYREQMENIFDRFPRESVNVQLFEEMTDEPERVYTEVCRFIGIDDGFVPESIGSPVNSYIEFRSVTVRKVAQRLPGRARDLVGKLNTRSAVSYPPMSGQVRQQLEEVYAKANDGLADLLGRPLPW